MSQAVKDKERRKQMNAIAIVAIIALLGINIYMFMSSRSKDQTIVQQAAEIDKADELNKTLEAEYQAAMQELDAKQAENEEMAEIIAQQKENLAAMKKKIERNISKGVTTESSLKEALSQIGQLKEQKIVYLQQIDDLKAENANLTEATVMLKAEKESLVETIQVKEKVISTVESEKAKVESAKAKVEEENKDLSNKVARAGVLNVRNMDVKPMRLRNSGKEKDTDYAKRVEQFVVCFDVIQNDLTEPGRNKFLLRIIDPLGTTIAVESKGSGTFSSQSDAGTQMRFTTSKSFEYNNDAPNVCIDWLQEQKLTNKGDYTFEIYNKGYLAGKKVVTLK